MNVCGKKLDDLPDAAQDEDAPRPYTQEEVREKFLNYLANMVSYWNGIKPSPKDGDPTLYKMNGLVFSILSMLDGCAGGMPAFEVIPNPHPDDREYDESNGENWWPEPSEEIKDAVTVHGDSMLHEMWHKYEPKE